MSTQTFTLGRDSHGRLTLTTSDGTQHEGVVPVRAFPISAPDDGLSLVSSDGHELVWIDRPEALPTDQRTLISEDLALREFTPTIQRITDVSTFATPSTWVVDTDRGPTTFVLKTEDDIRRLGGGRLLIASGQGMQFGVPQVAELDRHSRKLLERFL
ncbi:DUF1854 domain-containing protein [Aquabacterium sp.]|uniref:cyanophycin metabolism-associated DUF1854 family protein n=1 Tax=Aquabacterium sp. TaxID=1872578 RepID=UPI001DB4CD9F|nr:DUF1854 domain-containing protein [Aquabacterium sp.]MBT9609370.1 DUF1854 domain-containing protein [Aquabacterium sp.]|tara:strand:+ start:567 stop:1037 length:471 start_codon:yes stop_codon:yes gene_type:complete